MPNTSTLTPNRPIDARRGPPLIGWVGRSLAAVRGRLAAARPRRRGSILILVVALLVLLALIGTAFITSAGADRDASVQHGYNIQIGLLIDGVREVVEGTIRSDIAPVDPPKQYAAGAVTFRPASPAIDTSLDGTYEPMLATPDPVNKVPKYYRDVEFVRWDAFLAERFPARPAAGGGPPEWEYVTASPLAGKRDPTGTDKWNIFASQFKSPYVNGSTNPAEIVTRYRLAPTFLKIPTPTGVQRMYPAFKINDNDDPNVGKIVLAADADGDGIADSGLFELPVGQINGVRYYAAVRIIDNCAAINASVAWENAETGSTPGTSITPVNVGLKSLLDPQDPPAGPTTGFTEFNKYRFGDQNPTAGMAVRDGATPGADANVAFWTPYDAFWTMLGSRLDNPGYVTATNKFRALGLTESAALAYRFCLANPNGTQGNLERFFPNSLRGTLVNRQPYSPDLAENWFTGIFDYDTLTPTATPIRPLLVGHNAVSNFVPSFVERLDGAGKDMVLGYNPVGADAAKAELRRAGQYRFRGDYDASKTYHIGEWIRYEGSAWVSIARQMGHTPNETIDGTNVSPMYWAKVPWLNSPVKINPNTASFGQLLAAYYAVMADGPNTPLANIDPGYGGTVVGTFHNPVRNGVTPLSAEMAKQLRAAQAAVNTIDLRDADDDVTSRTVMLADDAGGAVTAVVYGMERQPYITEAVVHVDELSKPYVAVELFNPYPTDLDLTAFRFAYRSRATPGAPVEIVKLTGTIPAYGYRYYENASGDRPPPASHFTAPTGTTQDVPTLVNVVKEGGGTRELLLLRTRRFKAAATGSPTELSNLSPVNKFDEANLADLVPADQLDFVGIAPDLVNSTQKPEAAGPVPYVSRFHYRRATAKDPGTGTDPWHCVYGGPYMSTGTPAQANNRRQWGWVRDPWPTTPPDVTTCTDCGWGDKKQLPPAAAEPTRDDFAGATNQATYKTRTLQVNSEGLPGPWKPGSTGATPPKFPFGGFARVGDLLAVTYVGAHRIGNDAAAAEMNSVSMDAAMAEDGDKDDNYEGNYSLEQLGRFAPIVFGSINDLEDRPSAAAPNAGKHRYAWARDLFDYFTVNCPQDDYQANVDPAKNPEGFSGDPTLIKPSTVTTPDDTLNPKKWPFDPFPQAVANGLERTDPLQANNGKEDGAATHGLININTANWKVISTLPFTANPTTNQAIAKMIVAHRDTVGPYRNLFDLLRVGLVTVNNPPPSNVVFRDAAGSFNSNNPSLTTGDLSPIAGNNAASAADDFVTGDFESRYLMINRISNLVTFKSDSFTAYLLVQGWRNAGTSAPELVVQRRLALVVDRATVKPEIGGAITTGNPGLGSVISTTIPNN
jgi:hypothetical protein